MKYLVVAKRNNIPVPMELGLRLARALKKYLNAGLQEGRFDCVYFLEDGAMSINNASSHEEVLGQIIDNPYWPYVTWEIKALADMNQIADKTIELWEKAGKEVSPGNSIMSSEIQSGPRKSERNIVVGLYARFILPKFVNFNCSLKPLMQQRTEVVPLARGNVLEVGFGSGLNLPSYDRTKVQHVWALDPSTEMWAMASKKAQDAGFPVEFLNAPAEAIPLPDQSADTVLVTYALCTIPDVQQALREMARVLKPGGDLVFCEHGEAPDENVRRWQNRLNPIWKSIGGGCNLNRPIPTLLEQGGFRLSELHSMYIPVWKPAAFTFWGKASVG